MPTCSCGATFYWAHSREGKIHPITEPKHNGNVLMWREGKKLNYRILPEYVIEVLREEGVPLRLNHFADCPDADRYGGAAAERAARANSPVGGKDPPSWLAPKLDLA